MELQPKPGIMLAINGQPLVEAGAKPLEGREVNGYKAGEYQTPLGIVGIRLEHRNGQDGGYVEEVILDCTRSETLQGSKGKIERAIQVNLKGRGKQQLSQTDMLSVQLEGRERLSRKHNISRHHEPRRMTLW